MNFDILHNFISPVTGRILSITDYVLVGDREGIAMPSPILVDLRLDLINLKYDFNVTTSASFVIGSSNAQLPNAQVLSDMPDGFMLNTEGIVSTTNTIPSSFLPNLSKGYLWIGDNNDRPIEVKEISINNMPDLSEDAIWVGSSKNRPKEVTNYVQDTTPLPLPTVIPGNVAVFNFGYHNIKDSGIDIATLATELDIANLQGQITTLQGQILILAEDIYGPFFPPFSPVPPVTTIGIIPSIITLQAQILATEVQIQLLQEDVEDIDERVDILENMTIDGFVIGGPPDKKGIIITERGPTCLLTNIPAGGNVDIDQHRITNLYQSPIENFDALSAQFLWDLIHDEVEIIWL